MNMKSMPTGSPKKVSERRESPAKNRLSRRSSGPRRSFLSSLSFPPTKIAANTSTAAATIDKERTLLEELTHPINLAGRARKSAAEAESFRSECDDLSRQVGHLSQMLKSTLRLITSIPPQSLYDRPIRRIVTNVSKNIERALDLLRKCKQFLSHLFITSPDFKKVSSLLESSISDMRWLLSMIEGDGRSTPSPITSSEPNLAIVWCTVATLLMGKESGERIEAVNRLTSLAMDSEPNGKMIVEEGAVQPLLRLLKDGGGTANGQIAAANALLSLANYMEMTRVVSASLGIPLIVQVLRDSSIRVQTVVADLVAKMAEVDEKAKDEFGSENVLKPLVSCLTMDLVLDDLNNAQRGNASIHSVNHTILRIHSASFSFDYSSRGGQYEIDRIYEPLDVKLKLKTSCALALWKLCEGSLLNSQKISEGDGLLCLSKIIETERGEVQLKCLMTVMEITKLAESYSGLRKVAWKPSAAPVKAVLGQLLRLLREETDPRFQIPVIKALGYLARTFSAKETKVIFPLVVQLGSTDVDVAAEAAIALGKFVRPDNFNCKEHSKAIIECNGVTLIKKMIGYNELCRMHGIILLCYLSLHVENSSALEDARVLETINAVARLILVQNPDLKELIVTTMQKLKLYHSLTYSIV